MPLTSTPRHFANSTAYAGFVIAWLVTACATQAPAPPPARPLAPSSEMAFDAGVEYAVDDLLIQLRRLPVFNPPAPSGFLKKEDPVPPRGVIAVDPAIDGSTGQQTIASKSLDSRLLQRASEKFTQFDVAPVMSINLSKAHYLLTGTLTTIDASAPGPGTFRINLALTEIRTGMVVAQSVARVRGEGIDTTPTPFYRDSPSLTKDRVVDGQIRTAQTPTGIAADELYLSRLPTSALISEGSRLYEANSFVEALRYYESAAGRPDGQQLRVFNGLYLTNAQLGRAEEAENAFGKIAALGLATNSFSVKFLFRPGLVEFWPDPKISGPYSMWLRLIAREISASGVCLTIVGHASRTGNEQFNERLSLQRAIAIQRRIETQAPDTKGRLQSVGMGSRENLVGTGSDDLGDALDRRVEFKVRTC